METRTKKTLDYIRDATKVHGTTYGYDDVNYIKTRAKIDITCFEHGNFSQLPLQHLYGSGCPKCHLQRTRMTTEKLKEQLILKHKGQYGYDLVEYKSANDKITITCFEHGNFEQYPFHHLGGSKCNDCAVENKKHSQEYVLELFKSLHKDANYDYSLVKYVNNYTKVEIICNNHSEPYHFLQTPTGHLKGHGCIKCAGQHIPSNEEFKERCRVRHRNLYEYDETIYTGIRNEIQISCKIHGLFQQSAWNHLHGGNGCPDCTNKSEGILLKWLNDYSTDICGVSTTVESQVKFSDLISEKGGIYKFDFCIDGLIMIELDGLQHFEQVLNWQKPEENMYRDIEKTKYLVKNNYHLIRIYQKWVYDNCRNWEEKLRNAIEQLYYYDGPDTQIIYIGEEGMYDKHKEAISEFI